MGLRWPTVWARNILWNDTGGDGMVLADWVRMALLPQTSMTLAAVLMNSIVTIKGACCWSSKTCGCPLCTGFVSG